MSSAMFGFLAAIAWGAADFIGGLAARKMSAFKVVAVGWIIGLVLMPLLALITKEAQLTPAQMGYCMIAGLLGSGGIVLFYFSLAKSKMSLVAPITGLLTGVIPVIIGFIIQGLPGALTLFGIVLALMAVLLISNEGAIYKGITIKWDEIKYPILCGAAFGFYLFFMHKGSPSGVFWPMTFTHISGVLLILASVAVLKKDIKPKAPDLPYIISNFTFDLVGTIMFILASQTGRLDVASVLSSLYPGITILMAVIILRERMTKPQIFGVLLAMVAIALLSL